MQTTARGTGGAAATPEIIADHVGRYVEQGVRIVGGSCGSTPAHVAAIVAAVR